MKKNLVDLLEYINPCTLDYNQWLNVGMALKHEGYSVNVWDAWSQKDSSRYRSRECGKKWAGFNGSASPVTGGMIVHLAKENGYRPYNEGCELAWDSVIGEKDDLVIVDKNWLNESAILQPEHWNPAADLIAYLETLFQSHEYVGYVCESWEKDGNTAVPARGVADRPAGRLIEQLRNCEGDIGKVFGDYNPKHGAWIRFNPTEKICGKNSVKNENITDFRHCLVESDSVNIDRQNAIMRELELPISCLVHSGNKSLHAIVKVDAGNYEEYRKRVDFIYNVCKKNGLEVDSQCRNPSRLSRMPGVLRGQNKQFLIDTNIGKSSFAEWREWIEAVNDDLPTPENMADVFHNLPELSPPLINGILRQGHKMLVAGPSKAGKSYSLIELCCAIAEGKKWIGFDCTQGRVMYVNLELDRASCLHRFRDVYEALEFPAVNLQNIDIWNLRGKSVPMDKLAPKLIRRAAKKNYIAIVIDPIYKVITGDENSADQMAHFCNQFDKVCTELGCAVIYCHHHSKGSQSGKRSMDRASGSGVFARDPDALLDLIEIEISENLVKQRQNSAVCSLCLDYIKTYVQGSCDEISQDDMASEKSMLETCQKLLRNSEFRQLKSDIETAKKDVKLRTAWRVEGTLREFPKFAPVNLWFEYPIHSIDTSGVLGDLVTEPGKTSWGKNSSSEKSTPINKADQRKKLLENAYETLSINGKVTLSDIMEYANLSRNTVKNYIDEHPEFSRDKEGTIVREVSKMGVKLSN